MFFFPSSLSGLVWKAAGPPAQSGTAGMICSSQAGLRTVYGSNLRRGRNPSSVPGTSSTRRTPAVGKTGKTFTITIQNKHKVTPNNHSFLLVTVKLQGLEWWRSSCCRSLNLFKIRLNISGIFKINVTHLTAQFPSQTGLSAIGWRFLLVTSYLSRVLRLILVDKIHQEKPKEQQDRWEASKMSHTHTPTHTRFIWTNLNYQEMSHSVLLGYKFWHKWRWKWAAVSPRSSHHEYCMKGYRKPIFQ